MSAWLMLLVVSCLIVFSLIMRIRIYRNTIENVDVKPSPLSMAIQDLVATAGGLYISFVTLVSFLKLDLPDKVSFFNIGVDPLAIIALVITIIQPIFTHWIKKQ